MPDRDVGSIRDLIYYQDAKIIVNSAFAATDGVQGLYSFYRLKHRGDKKFHDSIPPLLVRLRKESHNVMGVPLIGPLRRKGLAFQHFKSVPLAVPRASPWPSPNLRNLCEVGKRWE
jgi:hypothetical protein